MSKELTDLEILKAADEWLTEEHFYQTWFGVDERGAQLYPLPGNVEHVMRTCAVGSIALVCARRGFDFWEMEPQPEAVTKLSKVVMELYPDVPTGTGVFPNIVTVNDSLGLEAVKAVFAEAIRREEATSVLEA